MVNNSYNKIEPYELLQFYKNIVQIRKYTINITNQHLDIDFRIRSQMRNAARSAKQNIIEGYKKDSALSFANFIKISLGSLRELLGDYEDCYDDKLISETEYDFIFDMIRKTCYMIERYLDSLYKLNNNGQWKKRWK